MTTAGDIKDALHVYYNKPSQGRDGEKYICLEEARSGAGFSGNDGSCDFLAINTWQGRGMELLGHETKVTYADWRRELAQEYKADRFAQFCHRWWVVIPSDLVERVQAELPPAWGLMALTAPRNGGVGKIKVVESAMLNRKPRTVPEWWWIGWLAQIDRQHKRRFPDQLARAMTDERALMRAQIDEKVEADVQHRLSRYVALDEQVAALKEATGIDLHGTGLWRWEIPRLKQAWDLIKTGRIDLPGLATQLETVAAALRGAVTTEVTVDG